jgi:hypothetical protein
MIPVLPGEGISPFGSLEKDAILTHERTQAFESGFVQTTCPVKKT